MTRRRFVLAAPMRLWAVAVDPASRPPRPADGEALAQLMADAYRGTVDDEGETIDDARATVAELFDGHYGNMLWAVSEVTEADGRIVACTLVTLWQQRPFVAFVLTAPAYQHRGLARAGLMRTFNRLAAGDETVLRLVVTQGNTPAVALYDSLGFVPEAQPPFTTA